jgi:hypothetical protein
VSARPPLEVADIFRCPEVTGQIARCSGVQQRTIRALTACRTAALGGHVDACDQCGHRQISYNSCRNRHCPKGRAGATAEWVTAQERSLLPVPYCHIVFTLPRALAPLVLQNHRTLYAMLFRAASESLLELASDPAHLGARTGCLAILHTWGQTLQLHPHLHCLVPAGGLAADGSRWVASRGNFFLPVRVLSRLFRGKYLSFLRRAHTDRKLVLRGGLNQYQRECDFSALLHELRGREWVVFARPPVHAGKQVLKYLARYTHRIAISNSRLERLQDRKVTFSWKDYARGNRQRSMQLDVQEFARRFLLHVLPEHFVRIRYYGILANACRERDLAQCRSLLNAHEPTPAERAQPAKDVSQPDLSSHRCPVCGKGQMQHGEVIPPNSS